MSALCLDIPPAHLHHHPPTLCLHHQPCLPSPHPSPAAEHEAFENGYLFIWRKRCLWGLFRFSKKPDSSRWDRFPSCLFSIWCKALLSLLNLSAPSLAGLSICIIRGKSKQNWYVTSQISFQRLLCCLASCWQWEMWLCHVIATKCNLQDLNCVKFGESCETLLHLASNQI